ncbi:hypothetical protein REH81_04100 [Vibrio rotiferianus]
MGYRYRLGQIPKSAKAIYADKSYSDCDAMMEFVFAPPEHSELYCMGDLACNVDEDVTPFFPFDLSAAEGHDFSILSRAGLVKLIEAYRDRVTKYYADMVERDNHLEMVGYVTQRSRIWDCRWSNPVRIDEPGDGEMSRSDDMEYAVFNLLFILKTFDFESNYLILNGW